MLFPLGCGSSEHPISCWPKPPACIISAWKQSGHKTVRTNIAPGGLPLDHLNSRNEEEQWLKILRTSGMTADQANPLTAPTLTAPTDGHGTLQSHSRKRALNVGHLRKAQGSGRSGFPSNDRDPTTNLPDAPINKNAPTCRRGHSSCSEPIEYRGSFSGLLRSWGRRCCGRFG